MEFLSLDVETSGLDPEQDQILEFGAVIEDTNNLLNFDEIPKFHAILKHDRYSGSAYAINMNARIFAILKERVTIQDEQAKIEYDNKFNLVHAENLARDFYYWCMMNMKNIPTTTNKPIFLLVAGKNFTAFDMPFIKKLPEWEKFFKFRHRSIDPVTLYTDFIKDKIPPSLEECLKRAGIEEEVTHDAVQDAWQVIKILRKKY